MTEYEKILQQYWGYQNFRPLQQEIIESICAGKDTLALMPTGGGKSITFQVAALSKPGICIVVTPLIALMKDQVDALKKRSIKAVAVYSGMSHIGIEQAYNNCILGDYKFLYISPERIKTKQFISVLSELKVNILAIDEAHCISQWGYDFRPSYLEIAEIRQYIPRAPILALTATATPDVVVDIQEKLLFKEKNVLSKSFERKNLTYKVCKKNDKIGELRRICSQIKGTGIVYVRSRKEAKEVAYQLQQDGFVADFYHAGLDAETRARKQDIWMRTPNEIMVATNAFGMGIDKPDVRFVVHISLPESLEAYFQEAGRAGRDEKDATAYMLYNDADIELLKTNFEKKYPSLDFIKKIYEQLYVSYGFGIGEGRNQEVEFDVIEFCKTHDFPIVETVNAIAILERQGFLVQMNDDEYVSRIQFRLNRGDLYKYQVEHSEIDEFVKFLLRNCSGVFTDLVKIHEPSLARIARCDVSVITQYLTELARRGVMTYIPVRKHPVIFFCDSRVGLSELTLDEKQIEKLKTRQRERLQSVIAYVTNTSKCRSIQLLEYFGEKVTVRCGTCDVCEVRNDVEVSSLTFDYIVEDLKKQIGEKPASVADILEQSTIKDDQQVMNVIKYLLDKGKLVYTDGAQLIWKHS